MTKSKKPKPKKVRQGALKDETIGQALKKFRGMQYLAAEALGIAQSTLSDRIKYSPYLKEISEEATEKRLDLAEFNLSDLVEEKNLGAICFLLKTKGKARGYKENSDDVIVSIDVEQKFDALMDQLDEAQKQAIQTSKSLPAN